MRLTGSHAAAPPSPATRLIENLLDEAPGGHLGERIALLDLLLWVREHFNQRVDRMTMFNSVEARVPFQDNEVVDLALALPYRTRAPFGRPKHLLKAAFRRDVPEFVLDRPKRPFAAPMAAWLKGPLRPLLAETLAQDRVRDAGLVDPTTAAEVTFGGPTSRDIRRVMQVWTLFMLHLWAEGLRRAAHAERSSAACQPDL
jgi:asparagine synthase (glutamine-hydrolysing)